LVLVEISDDIRGLPVEIRRTDRFMGLLGVLSRAAVDPRRVRQVTRPEIAADEMAGGGYRFARGPDPVRPAIGDQPNRPATEIDSLVEPLRDPHRAACRQSELAGRLLLQGRGGEWRERVAADLAAVDFGDGKTRSPQNCIRRRPRFGLGIEIEAVETFA